MRIQSVYCRGGGGGASADPKSQLRRILFELGHALARVIRTASHQLRQATVIDGLAGEDESRIYGPLYLRLCRLLVANSRLHLGHHLRGNFPDAVFLGVLGGMWLGNLNSKSNVIVFLVCCIGAPFFAGSNENAAHMDGARLIVAEPNCSSAVERSGGGRLLSGRAPGGRLLQGFVAPSRFQRSVGANLRI